MKRLTIKPRQGRDYTSASRARADFMAGKDFTSCGLDSYGQAVNLEDCQREGLEGVCIRYARETKAVNVDILKGERA